MSSIPSWLAAAGEGSELHKEWCRATLETYWRRTAHGRPLYSGSRFDDLGDNPPNHLVADDIVAVSMLSVDVPAHATLRFLDESAAEITRLLTAIPADVDLHEAGVGLVDHGSPADDLWSFLRTNGDTPGAGPVTTSKLLARKRPRLLPVYDDVVRGKLGLRGPQEHWLVVQGLLREDPRRVDVLRRARESAKGVPSGVALLRVLDVLLWMSDERRCPPPS
ncbi:DUF6308 family protein [Actinomycetospora atypica]|uniref:DUF6308 family protein n=1 Tax=Actinomycetospora atypica TaxID=1290095 RepID=A0ABV9YIV5_9PSEU